MSIKKYELKPTEENIYNSILEDTLGRNKYVWRFCKLLNEIEDSCVLALDASWGEGKTFFVKQVKMFIESYSGKLKNTECDEQLINKQIEKNSKKDRYENDLKPQICFYYDAWENDDDEEPLISLMYYMALQVGIDIKESHIMDQVLSITDQFSIVKIKEVVDIQKKKDILSEKKNKEEIKKIIREFLEKVHIEKGERAVIFIDELDRCKPTYAIKLLERIKHYFDFDNITFVFSVNLAELQHTVKEYYGEGFDGYGYLNRFFDHVLDIPEADTDYYLKSISLDYNAYYFDIIAKEAIRQYELSVRETEKYVRTLRNSIGEWIKRRNEVMGEEQYSLNMIGSIMIPIMLAIKIKDIDRYNSFISGNDLNSFISFIDNIITNKDFIDVLINSEEESFRQVDGKKHVIREERISKLYEYIFDDYKKNTATNRRLGRIVIMGDTKENLINACSMLSDYTLFDE